MMNSAASQKCNRQEINLNFQDVFFMYLEFEIMTKH